MRRVTEAAYAKVNLTLAVTGRRADGYHTIESLFQSVSLCDKLTLEQRERGFWLNETAGIPAEENIITRADRLLRREFPNLGGVAVTLEKNIPTQAGLGGGSTDAAAYLRGMDRLYGLGLGREGLRALAAELGADVPFCIDGGAAAAAGIGERLTPVESHLAAVAGDHQAEGGVLHPGHVPADRRDGREPAAALYYPRGGKGAGKGRPGGAVRQPLQCV